MGFHDGETVVITSGALEGFAGTIKMGDLPVQSEDSYRVEFPADDDNSPAGESFALVNASWIRPVAEAELPKRCEASNAKHSCSRPPVMFEISRWAGLLPACKVHVASIQRRRWDTTRFAQFAEPAMAKWLNKQKAAKERREAEAEVKAEQLAKSTAAATIRAAEETARKIAVVRDDEEHHDWDASRAAGEPRMTYTPRFKTVPADGGSQGWFRDAEVKLTDSYGQPRLEVRHSSELTPNEARALVDALQSALSLIDAK